ncbi:MAG: hypothetical protein U1E78_10260 [Gammaproteobacteria bacterium]
MNYLPYILSAVGIVAISLGGAYCWVRYEWSRARQYAIQVVSET